MIDDVTEEIIKKHNITIAEAEKEARQTFTFAFAKNSKGEGVEFNNKNIIFYYSQIIATIRYKELSFDEAKLLLKIANEYFNKKQGGDYTFPENMETLFHKKNPISVKGMVFEWDKRKKTVTVQKYSL